MEDAVKQVWRILVAALAIAALAAGGTVAFAQRGGGKGHAKKAVAERQFTFPAGTLKDHPEGVAFDKRTKTFFVGSRGDGTIFSGRPDQAGNELSVFIPGTDGKSALGMKVRRGRLYVAGGATGTITVYDLRTKDAVASFETGSGGFLNDLVVTGRGDVFVTDSLRPKLWHVTAAQVRAGSGTVQGLDTPPGDIGFQEGAFNLNGIVARSGHKLIVVNTTTGGLFRIDLNQKRDAIRRIDQIDGVTVKGGDGLLLDRGRLLVVQGGPPQISFVKLHHGARRGEVRSTRTSDLLDGPSTIARAGKLYLVVNANFAQDAPPPNVAALLRNRGGRNH
jgi:sugar lactone lactonase YvrE